MNSVVVVESPAKAKTIEGYLGDSYSVIASFGHVRDMEDKDGAVIPGSWSDIKWSLNNKGKKQVKEILSLLKKADHLILATDPDREGEAIAWHIYELLNEKGAIQDIKVSRAVFNSITKSSVLKAIEKPRAIDQDLVDAYLARRILDHLIGFKVSPLLWRHVSRAKSAGRVQSPTLRIICEKEDERDAHVAEEFWPLKATFTFEESQFDADLVSINDRNLSKDQLNNEEEVNQVIKELDECSFLLSEVETKPQSSSPKPPFRTATLQMAASSSLGFGGERTMNVAQKLYQNGLITYLRTDSNSISSEPNEEDPFSEENPGPAPLHEIRNLISDKFGNSYLSEKIRVYKGKVVNSQEAHEAIRPTDIFTSPNEVSLSNDEEKLYTLIWNRTVASQMVNSRYERKILTIESSDKKYTFKASSRKNLFLGFETLTNEGEETEFQFPENLVRGLNLELTSKDVEKKFSKPPNRFSEASLIKRMEEEGIGRPSTYATIVKGLRDKKYTYGSKSIAPSDLGRILTSYLKSVFKDFFIETKFTAKMESNLDEIASGNKSWQSVLDKFWVDLQQYLNKKINEIEISNKDEFKTRQVLDLLNEELHDVIFPKTKDGLISKECPKCSEEISLKSGAWGYFVGCAKCKWTKKPFDFQTKWETYQELPKDLGVHPDLNEIIFADMTINGPCVWTMKEEKKIFGTPDDDEFILDIGLNRAIELIERSNAENILFAEINTGLPITLKNGRFGEYTEYDGFNKATKLKPEDKAPSPKVSYYEPHTIDYESESGRRHVLDSLRIIGFVYYKDGTVKPVGIKIRKPGKAFKFVKNLKIGDQETEVPSDWYKLEKDQQSFIVNETLQLKEGDEFKYLEDCELI